MIHLRWQWGVIPFSLKKKQLKNEQTKFWKKNQTDTSRKWKGKVPVKESKNFKNMKLGNLEKKKRTNFLEKGMRNFPKKESKNVVKWKK